MTRDNLPRYNSGRLMSYAWPGGYPIIYLDAHGCVLCPDCANEGEQAYALSILGDMCEWCLGEEPYGYADNRDLPHSGDIYWEGPPEICEVCNCEIESAYGEPDDRIPTMNNSERGNNE